MLPGYSFVTRECFESSYLTHQKLIQRTDKHYIILTQRLYSYQFRLFSIYLSVVID